MNKLFAILNDGKWHSTSEIANQIDTQDKKLIEFAQFLCHNGIVHYEYEKENCRIKITDEWQNLLPIRPKQPSEAQHEPQLKPWGIFQKKKTTQISARISNLTRSGIAISKLNPKP